MTSRTSVSLPPPAKRAGTRGRPGRPRLVDRGAVDEDGTPSIYRLHIKTLKKYGKFTTEITEKQSMDWRASQVVARQELDEIARNMAFVPRRGELVLWASNLKNDRLEVNPTNNRVEVYDAVTESFRGAPEWKAGLISQTPSGTASVNYLDILKRGEQSYRSITYTGFRVETCPDPRVNDKILQQTHEYVSMSQIRPLSLWQYLLQGLDQNELHHSIKDTLSYCNTVSLAMKTRFTGYWPRAIISCNAIYIGSELYVKNDAVRFSIASSGSRDNTVRVNSILVIQAIHLNLSLTDTNLQEGAPFAESASITLLGRGYSTIPKSAGLEQLSTMEVKTFLPPGLGDYGAWYPLHAEDTLMSVPFHHVIGRCYEPAALNLIFGDSPPSLSYDVSSVLSQRAFSLLHDPRIGQSETWFWADTRAQALSLTALNGEDIGPFDDTRSPVMWRGILRAVDGTAYQKDLRDAKVLTTRGRKPGGEASQGKKPSLTAMGVGIGGALTEDESVDSLETDSDEMDLD